ncbi:hypothetical protein [Candidatus Binatus sp.]|uniref:hypothetical protein n=1 Tax=Candidatus Binatus sp. TaxID=2811406 RepID=UPI003BAF728E
MLVEHLACVSQVADMDARLFEILFPARQARFVILALVADSSRKIEHVKFGRGMTQQMSEVPESFTVL